MQASLFCQCFHHSMCHPSSITMRYLFWLGILPILQYESIARVRSSLPKQGIIERSSPFFDCIKTSFATSGLILKLFNSSQIGNLTMRLLIDIKCPYLVGTDREIRTLLNPYPLRQVWPFLSRLFRRAALLGLVNNRSKLSRRRGIGYNHLESNRGVPVLVNKTKTHSPLPDGCCICTLRATLSSL